MRCYRQAHLAAHTAAVVCSSAAQCSVPVHLNTCLVLCLTHPALHLLPCSTHWCQHALLLLLPHLASGWLLVISVCENLRACCTTAMQVGLSNADT
ncbi:hypothetical protein COO60DRAFT_1497566 [Scenedesmus sp. NREL 46B-D3]|nr:hypothetical protein COO60DRAFT_1497566 [Scenedesmus sp. NREL 46B-D3]